MRRDPDPDLRYDPRENIETALFAMGEMGLYRWWSTYPIAKANIAAARGQEIEAIKYKVFLPTLRVKP